MSADLLARYQSADTSAFLSLGALGDRERVLWVLAVGKDIGLAWMTPFEISTVLRDGFGHLVSRQRVQVILSAEKETVAWRRKSGLRVFQIMQAGVQQVSAKGPDVVFIDPSKALTGIRSAQAVLGSLVGLIRFCDPYVESASLDLLADATAATEIRLLTVNISKPQAFARDLTAFRKEHGSIQVRQAQPGTLHDRYAVDDARMLLFGTSLNGLGKKQSFIVELGEDLRATVRTAFDAAWLSAKAV